MAAPLAVLALFWNALELAYVWDDQDLFVLSQQLHHWRTALHALTQPVIPESGYFRPLALLSFVLEFQYSGVDPEISHGINLGLHAANTALVCVLARHLSGLSGSSPGTRTLQTILAGLFYGLHPAMIEPVAWASARFDLLVTLFVLLALFADSTLRALRWRAPALALCFAAAALSKEMAVTFPALLFMYQRITRWRSLSWQALPRFILESREWVSYALLLLTGAAYLLLKLDYVGTLSRTDPTVEEFVSASLGLHITLVLNTLNFYLGTLVWPFSEISPIYPFTLESLHDGPGLGATLTTLVVLVALVGGLVRTQPALCLSFAGVIALLPVLNILPLGIAGSIGHTRFLTLPLAFFALALSNTAAVFQAMAPRLQLLSKLVPLLAVAWLALAATSIRTTLPLWRNDLSLWSWAFALHADAPYVQHRYLRALLVAQRPEQAAQVFYELSARGPVREDVVMIYRDYLNRTGQRGVASPPSAPAARQPPAAPVD